MGYRMSYKTENTLHNQLFFNNFFSYIASYSRSHPLPTLIDTAPIVQLRRYQESPAPSFRPLDLYFLRPELSRRENAPPKTGPANR